MHTIKLTRSRGVLFGALVAGLSLAAGPAVAGTPVYLDAAAGHKFLSSGEALYKDAQTDDGLLRIVDGRKVKLTSPDAEGLGPTGTRTWVIHIPIDTSGNWSVIARGSVGSGTTGQNGHRICSFDSNGNFSNCGGQVAVNQTSTVLVPVGGSAFSQTTLSNIVWQFGMIQPSLTIASIRAWTP